MREYDLWSRICFAPDGGGSDGGSGGDFSNDGFDDAAAADAADDADAAAADAAAAAAADFNASDTGAGGGHGNGTGGAADGGDGGVGGDAADNSIDVSSRTVTGLGQAAGEDAPYAGPGEDDLGYSEADQYALDNPNAPGKAHARPGFVERTLANLKYEPGKTLGSALGQVVTMGLLGPAKDAVSLSGVVGGPSIAGAFGYLGSQFFDSKGPPGTQQRADQDAPFSAASVSEKSLGENFSSVTGRGSAPGVGNFDEANGGKGPGYSFNNGAEQGPGATASASNTGPAAGPNNGDPGDDDPNKSVFGSNITGTMGTTNNTPVQALANTNNDDDDQVSMPVGVSYVTGGRTTRGVFGSNISSNVFGGGRRAGLSNSIVV